VLHDLVRLEDWGDGVRKGFVSTICCPSGIGGSGDADATVAIVAEYGGGGEAGGEVALDKVAEEARRFGGLLAA